MKLVSQGATPWNPAILMREWLSSLPEGEWAGATWTSWDLPSSSAWEEWLSCLSNGEWTVTESQWEMGQGKVELVAQG